MAPKILFRRWDLQKGVSELRHEGGGGGDGVIGQGSFFKWMRNVW